MTTGIRDVPTVTAAAATANTKFWETCRARLHPTQLLLVFSESRARRRPGPRPAQQSTDQRSDLNAARISPAKSSGCSQAAK